MFHRSESFRVLALSNYPLRKWVSFLHLNVFPTTEPRGHGEVMGTLQCQTNKNRAVSVEPTIVFSLSSYALKHIHCIHMLKNKSSYFASLSEEKWVLPALQLSPKSPRVYLRFTDNIRRSFSFPSFWELKVGLYIPDREDVLHMNQDQSLKIFTKGP